MEEEIAKLEKSVVVFFTLKNGKYVDFKGNEVTTEMLVKHTHHIGAGWNYMIIS